MNDVAEGGTVAPMRYSCPVLRRHASRSRRTHRAMDAEQGGKGGRNAPRAADKQAVRMFGCEATPPRPGAKAALFFFAEKKYGVLSTPGMFEPGFRGVLL